MCFKFYIALGLSFCMMMEISAQEVEQVNLEELLLEQLAEELGDNVDIADLLERLSVFLKKPLNLNSASEADLASLLFLTPLQISNLINHRKISGDFINILELQGIAGFTPQTILLLQNFVKVANPAAIYKIPLREILSNADHMLMFRFGRVLERQQGYSIKEESKSRYFGDPNRLALRYRGNYDDKIKIAFNAEKDAGEPFFSNKQRFGFDFYAGYLELNNLNKHITKVVIGDYALQFGQGLVVWNGLSFGKGAWIGSVAKQGAGLRGYSSLNENNFQRGVATKLEYGNWELTPFLAYNRLSGKVEFSDSTANMISTISTTGLHRTATELSYRNQIKQFVYGANVGYNYRRLKLNLTYLGLQFNGEVVRNASARNIYDFAGKNSQHIGLSYQTTYRNFYFFGEFAFGLKGGKASLNGVIASIHPQLSLFTTFRSYSKDFQNYYAQSLGEGTGVTNENGVYEGIVFHPNRKIEWVNYIDVFRFPWLRFNVDAPSAGMDFLSQFTYSWYKKAKLIVRYRHRLKQENYAIPKGNTNVLANANRDQCRVDYHRKINDFWDIRSRVELSSFAKEDNPRSLGVLVYQDVFWKGLSKIQLNIRVAFFNTSNYDSRIYAYESDVLYASSFPVYYDKGFRNYLNIRWRAGRKIDVWGRYAFTYYPDKDVIGSSLDLIQGKLRSEVKLQIRWAW